jgi:type I restriction enzyme S subunit
MSSRYPLKPLNEVLELDRDEVSVEPDVTYRLAGMYSFGRGVFERAFVPGTDMSYRSLFRLHENQVVMSRLNAWEGAVAVVDESAAGAFVSNEYPTFTIKRKNADPRYLAHLCRWPAFWEALRDRARGMGSNVGARRLRVHPEQLVAVEVPLPDVDEQRRVANRLDRLEAMLTDVRSLDAGASRLSDAVIPSMLHMPAKTRPIGDLVKQARREERVDASREYCLLGVRWYGEGLFVRERKPGSEVAATKLYRVEEGDFVYNRLFAWKGSFAVAGADVHNCHVSGEFPVFEVDRENLDARYLLAIFSDPSSWATVEDKSVGGTPTSRNRLKEQAFLALEIPVPPLEDQRRLVGLVERLMTARGGRRRRSVYMDGLRLSALNRAFAGLM